MQHNGRWTTASIAETLEAQPADDGCGLIGIGGNTKSGTATQDATHHSALADVVDIRSNVHRARRIAIALHPVVEDEVLRRFDVLQRYLPLHKFFAQIDGGILAHDALDALAGYLPGYWRGRTAQRA